MPPLLETMDNQPHPPVHNTNTADPRQRDWHDRNGYRAPLHDEVGHPPLMDTMDNQPHPPPRHTEDYNVRANDWSNSMSSAPTAHNKNSHDLERFKSPTTLPDVEHNEHVAQEDGLETTPSGNLTKTSSGLAGTRSAMGLHPTAPIAEEHDMAEYQDLWWNKIRLAFREPFAEFFGTFILVLFGDGSVAQVLLSAGETSAPGGSGYGAYQSISWG